MSQVNHKLRTGVAVLDMSNFQTENHTLGQPLAQGSVLCPEEVGLGP